MLTKLVMNIWREWISSGLGGIFTHPHVSPTSRAGRIEHLVSWLYVSITSTAEGLCMHTPFYNLLYSHMLVHIVCVCV